ncbi:MAG: hypothetical protein IJ802_05045 [Kiritimatiellae bacterium]|nr:hypothetical protein [Kiritimatiellia bacterium]
MDRKIMCAGIAALCAAFAALGDIYMAGDSTMCNYNPRQYPQQGWGQALAVFMKDPGQLHNRAVGGRSARSFKNEGRWQKLVDDLKEGDWVVIAFGHNDANKAKAERYSSVPDYKEIMAGFVRDARAKNANVVFATSIPHAGGFSEDGEGKMHVRGGAAGIGPYVQATVELGAELGVPVLDLNKLACENLPQLGIKEALRLYMRIEPGEYANCPNGKSDKCHTRDTGAYFYARAAVKMARELGLGICSHFKAQKDVVFTPIPREGPGAKAQPMKDDFSAEEIPYANEEAANKEGAVVADWQKEILNLRREGRRNGMTDEDAKKWAAQEFHRRHDGKKQ